MMGLKSTSRKPVDDEQYLLNFAHDNITLQIFMELYKPRKLTFKAWNKESRLLMRLDSISCAKGELFKKDHILLQFTGLVDNQVEEIYEMDIVLVDTRKFIVRWSDVHCGWS
jgi:hypothetical protein